MTPLSDTHVDAENVQLGVLRAKTPAQRGQLACSLTHTAIYHAKRAIRRAHPEFSKQECDLLFIEAHYGKEQADSVRSLCEAAVEMTIGSELLDALRPVVAVLEQLGVRYYVGGSVASSVHGVARTTLDVDLVAALDESHVKAFSQALSGGFYVSEPMIRSAIANRSSFNVIHLASSFKVDVFVPKARPYDQIVMRRVARETIGEQGGVGTWIASPEDVILNKLEWYRLGEEVSERQWSDIVLVMKIQQQRLDLGYLRKWAQDLGVSDLLGRALAEAQIECLDKA